MVLVGIVMPIHQSRAADKCPELGGEKAQNELAERLDKDPSCQHALATFRRCAWGSSADGIFSQFVIDKCERQFLGKLGKARRAAYSKRGDKC